MQTPLRSGHLDIKDAQYAKKKMGVKLHHIAFVRHKRSKAGKIGISREGAKLPGKIGIELTLFSFAILLSF